MQRGDETRCCISHGKYFVEKKIILRGFDLKKIEGSHTVIRQIRLQQSYTRCRRNNYVIIHYNKSTHGPDGCGPDVGTVDGVRRYNIYACEQNYWFYTCSTVYTDDFLLSIYHLHNNDNLFNLINHFDNVGIT